MLTIHVVCGGTGERSLEDRRLQYQKGTREKGITSLCEIPIESACSLCRRASRKTSTVGVRCLEARSCILVARGVAVWKDSASLCSIESTESGCVALTEVTTRSEVVFLRKLLDFIHPSRS